VPLLRHHAGRNAQGEFWALGDAARVVWPAAIDEDRPANETGCAGAVPGADPQLEAAGLGHGGRAARAGGRTPGAGHALVGPQVERARVLDGLTGVRAGVQSASVGHWFAAAGDQEHQC